MDFTGTVGPSRRDCFAATTTLPSSSAGFNITVPLMLWVAEPLKLIGALSVLTAMMLVLFAIGTPEMTAVEQPSR